MMNGVAQRLKVILSHLPKPVTSGQPTIKNIAGWEISPSPSGLEIASEHLFTEECIQFLISLVRKFESRVDEVFRHRVLNRCAIERGVVPNFSSHNSSNSDWKIDPIPKRLTNRKLDLGDISPSCTALLSEALNTKVQGIQVDFDDGHCPSWRNQLQGLYNVYLAVRHKLPETCSLQDSPVLMLRPRAWNMTEHNVMIDGREVPAPLLDFGVLMYHNAEILSMLECGPYFYLSKVESTLEAKLWDDIFTWTEDHLDLQFGTIKSCVLIENVLAAFEMESILYELRHHCIGLNCGIWDYSASIISLFGRQPEFVISDRTRYVNIDQLFLNSYIQLLVRVCHKHGALATGGMAAQVVDKNTDQNEIARQVCAAKLKEINLGLDGFMIHDVRLVPAINQLWDHHCSTDNQLEIELDHFERRAADLLKVPVGQVSLKALLHNIAVATLFIEAWLREAGTFIYQGSVEDSATAEISRWQVWQWLYHQVALEDTQRHVTRRLVFDLVESFVESVPIQDDQHHDRLIAAMNIFKELVTARDPPIFFTTYLNNHSIFLSFQKC